MAQETLMQSTAVELTFDDWLAMPEDEAGELVDGRLVEEEVPDYVHEVVVAFLIHLFRSWTAPRGGMVAGSGAKFAVSSRRGRKPDLTVYLPGSQLPPRRGLIRTPPDVAVEVVSPTPRDGRRDRVEKLDEYASFGVRFYWILDPELRSFEIFELGPDGRYARARGATGGQVADVPGFEGMVLDLDGLWVEIDRLEPAAEAEDD
jgi:Uma2 family endonuclease